MIDSNTRFPSEPEKPLPKPDFDPNVRQPEGSLWGVHDPAIFHDPTSGNYYLYCTSALCYKSEDLISWTQIDNLVKSPPQESIDWVGGDHIWAPDIIKVGNEYRLYCSSSKWGVKRSCIFLAVSDNAEGPFIPRGCVIKTDDESPANGIDANLIIDEHTGNHYMSYGSFWHGCFLLKLDPETGLSAEEGAGKQISARPLWLDASVEGPYIKYNPDTNFYYLFVSYGSLNFDYNIRVGRSKNIEGPYLDFNGRSMTDLTDTNNDVGYMLHCGYQFENTQAWMAPGHNSVLRDFDNAWYLISHIRQHNFHHPEASTMHCHKIFWSDDGWPLLNPCQYAKEKDADFAIEDIHGRYDRIKLVPMVPQGILTSVPMFLLPDGLLEMCSVRGSWQLLDGQTLQITYGNVIEKYHITPAWDYERWCPTIAITGIDQFGIGVKAKKI